MINRELLEFAILDVRLMTGCIRNKPEVGVRPDY